MKSNKLRVACIIGTRPEVIKMAPVIKLLNASKLIDAFVICTAQHRSLADMMLNLFDISPDVDLDIMRHDQTLSLLTSNIFATLDNVFISHHFDAVLAQGDTTTTYVAAMIAFYHKIPFGHIEAGLRSYNMYHPFPEELNRVLVSKIATWHFVPTVLERNILLSEQVKDENIFITGNTVIDSLYTLSNKHASLPISVSPDKRMLLMTLHRRENFGEPVTNIFKAIKQLIEKFPDIHVVYSVHPNPKIFQIAHDVLGDLDRVTLLEPQPYDVFVTLMNDSYFILSDSGGIQEEAPALQKPVLILREVTERPLVVEKGLAVLVGSDTNKIVREASLLLTNSEAYHAMQQSVSPYGDGHAAERIVGVIETKLNKVKS